jgi:hypothetical protein
MDPVIAQELPDTLEDFLGGACGVQAGRFRRLPAAALPEPARQLLVHDRDMTSVLAAFHGSALRVDLLQQREHEGVYLREVYLRTEDANRVVEYGVIAIALDQFTLSQQAAIRAGITPLGGLLHRFQIPFESAPIGFVAVPVEALAEGRRVDFHGPACFGRFNRLEKPGGEPLAWILEILPPLGGGPGRNGTDSTRRTAGAP